MWPAMWRVDGKTLLQKYEPFEENGKVLYRNISTVSIECAYYLLIWRPVIITGNGCSMIFWIMYENRPYRIEIKTLSMSNWVHGYALYWICNCVVETDIDFFLQYTVWNPDNKKLYTQVPVKVRSQTHLETIVELVRSELPIDDCNFIEKRMLETQMYQENFEVYIQTLISHALDPNFLTEIFQEQGNRCILWPCFYVNCTRLTSLNTKVTKQDIHRYVLFLLPIDSK